MYEDLPLLLSKYFVFDNFSFNSNIKDIFYHLDENLKNFRFDEIILIKK